MYKIKIFCILFLQMCIYNVDASERIALVIGNSNYEQLSSLDNPKNDAISVAKILREMNYETILVSDVNEKKLKKELKLFSNSSDKAKIALVYYAGHGAQVEGENYILPTDMEIPNSETDIKLSAIKVDDIINSIKSKTKLIFLDACRDNPALFKNFEKGRGSYPRGLSPQKTTTDINNGGIFIAYATDSGNISDDGPKNGNSPFTSAFIKYASEPISIDDVFTKITNEVKRTTNQKQRPFKYASLDGIICLNPACAAGLGNDSTTQITKNKNVSLNKEKWLEKDWAYIGNTFKNNDFFYIDTSSLIKLRNNQIKVRSLNFRLENESKPKFTDFNITEQIIDCDTRKTNMYEGVTYDSDGVKKSGFVYGLQDAIPKADIAIGSMGFSISNIACNYDLNFIISQKEKKWKKFFGFSNQTWFYELKELNKKSSEIEFLVKVEYDPILITKNENTVYPKLKSYAYAPEITRSVFLNKLNCEKKKMFNSFEMNFNDENIVLISAPFEAKEFEYDLSKVDENSPFGLLNKIFCEKK
jgi:hypothetical protein